MKAKGITRRQFLMTTAAAGGGAALLTGLPSLLPESRTGAPARERYYIFACFSGGWDILLSLDPRDPNEFHAGDVSRTQILPAYDRLDDETNDGSPVVARNGMVFGPYIGDLAKHADKLAVVRGMNMETLTHQAGMRRFLTGRQPSGLPRRGSSAATWLAGALGQRQVIPNLAVNVDSYDLDMPDHASALKAGGLSDLVQTLRTTSSRAAGLFDFHASTDAMAALRDHYGIPVEGPDAEHGPEVAAAMAVTAITADMSRVASVRLATGLDTHYADWTTDQGPAQARGFAAVARMVEDLQRRPYGTGGESWLDHTVIIGFSEFSRTATLNADGGRDHSLTNAAFLTGGPVKGGRFIGRSSDVGMAPMATNLVTGLPDPGGEVIRPEHVIRALLQDAGVADDVAGLRAKPLDALFG